MGGRAPESTFGWQGSERIDKKPSPLDEKILNFSPWLPARRRYRSRIPNRFEVRRSQREHRDRSRRIENGTALEVGSLSFRAGRPIVAARVWAFFGSVPEVGRVGVSAYGEVTGSCR